MTKKDYFDLAAAVKAAWTVRLDAPDTPSNQRLHRLFDAGRSAAVAAILQELCKRLHADNPRFDKARFLDVIGGAETERGN